MMHRLMTVAALAALAACNGGDGDAQIAAEEMPNPASLAATERRADGWPFAIERIGQFNEPWAMTFLPNGLLLVTEQPGTMKFVDLRAGRLGSVTGIPEVDDGGQGGLGDVLPHPDFASNNLLYISYAEAGKGDTRGAAVARGRLDCQEADACVLRDVEVIWRQVPKVEGRGHYGHRLAFGPDGKLYITSGERQKFDPAQNMDMNLGKVVRLNEDGSVPADNPFADRGGVTAQIWTLGHRNPLGIAFDASGRLWTHEMGPEGGDELNLIERGDNYGYPIVSNGDHYDGRDIPDHRRGGPFNAPEISWTPVISPAGFVIYSGDKFPEWRGTGLIGGLSSRSIVNVSLDENPRELDRYEMDERIREIEQGPDGYIYVLQDEDDGSGGALLRLTPAG